MNDMVTPFNIVDFLGEESFTSPLSSAENPMISLPASNYLYNPVPTSPFLGHQSALSAPPQAVVAPYNENQLQEPTGLPVVGLEGGSGGSSSTQSELLGSGHYLYHPYELSCSANEAIPIDNRSYSPLRGYNIPLVPFYPFTLTPSLPDRTHCTDFDGSADHSHMYQTPAIIPAEVEPTIVQADEWANEPFRQQLDQMLNAPLVPGDNRMLENEIFENTVFQPLTIRSEDGPFMSQKQFEEYLQYMTPQLRPLTIRPPANGHLDAQRQLAINLGVPLHDMVHHSAGGDGQRDARPVKRLYTVHGSPSIRKVMPDSARRRTDTQYYQPYPSRSSYQVAPSTPSTSTSATSGSWLMSTVPLPNTPSLTSSPASAILPKTAHVLFPVGDDPPHWMLPPPAIPLPPVEENPDEEDAYSRPSGRNCATRKKRDVDVLGRSFQNDPIRRLALDKVLASDFVKDNQMEPIYTGVDENYTMGLGSHGKSIYSIFVEEFEKGKWRCLFGDEANPCCRPKYFRRIERAVEHVRSHINHRPFICYDDCRSGGSCNKGFFAASYLKDHLQRNKKEKCPDCHESVLIQNMGRHRGRHTSEAPSAH